MHITNLKCIIKSSIWTILWIWTIIKRSLLLVARNGDLVYIRKTNTQIISSGNFDILMSIVYCITSSINRNCLKDQLQTLKCRQAEFIKMRSFFALLVSSFLLIFFWKYLTNNNVKKFISKSNKNKPPEGKDDNPTL